MGGGGPPPPPAHAEPPRAKVSRGDGGSPPSGSGGAASSSGAVRPNVPAPGTAPTAADIAMVEAVRTQVRIGAVSGSATTATPVGFNSYGQAVFRSDSERARRRDIERRRRQKGLHR